MPLRDWPSTTRPALQAPPLSPRRMAGRGGSRGQAIRVRAARPRCVSPAVVARAGSPGARRPRRPQLERFADTCSSAWLVDRVVDPEDDRRRGRTRRCAGKVVHTTVLFAFYNGLAEGRPRNRARHARDTLDARAIAAVPFAASTRRNTKSGVRLDLTPPPGARAQTHPDISEISRGFLGDEGDVSVAVQTSPLEVALQGSKQAEARGLQRGLQLGDGIAALEREDRPDRRRPVPSIEASSRTTSRCSEPTRPATSIAELRLQIPLYVLVLAGPHRRTDHGGVYHTPSRIAASARGILHPSAKDDLPGFARPRTTWTRDDFWAQDGDCAQACNRLPRAEDSGGRRSSTIPRATGLCHHHGGISGRYCRVPRS